MQNSGKQMELICVQKNGKCGYINQKKQVIIPLKYDCAWSFQENGLAGVKNSGKWGCVNQKGEEVIPCIYDRMLNFAKNGLAVAVVNGRFGYIDENNNQIVACEHKNESGAKAEMMSKMNGKSVTITMF